jgi:integrase
MDFLTQDQIGRLLRAASGNPRDYLMIGLGYNAGLRAQEICSLTRADVDISTAETYITIQRLKGSKRTTTKLLPAIGNALREYVGNMSPDKGVAANEYLFKGNRRSTVSRIVVRQGKQVTLGPHISYSAFYALFAKYCRQAGIPEHLHNPHALKHASAMTVLPIGGVKAVQKYLGHASASSSLVYLHITKETDAAVEQAFAGVGI